MAWPKHIPRRPGLRAKRMFDVVASAAGLAVLAPLLAALGVAGTWVHGWPPVFVQERPGIKGRIFRIVKLRTMTDARGPDGALLPDAARLTTFGRFLRATSLDELPELWNVLVGDMSLVGPRPLLVKYLGLYTRDQMRRHDMPPGITGWAQVHGRNALSWPEKLAMDLRYVDEWSFALDLELLGKTIFAVLSRQGISAPNDATMPEFTGAPDGSGGAAGRPARARSGAGA